MKEELKWDFYKDYYIHDLQMRPLEKLVSGLNEVEQLLYLLPLDSGISFNEMLQLQPQDIYDGFIKVAENKPIPTTERLNKLLHHVKNTAHFSQSLLNLEGRVAFERLLEIGARAKVRKLHHKRLQKIFGYNFYQSDKSLVQLTYIYGFDTIQETEAFIGVNDPHINKILNGNEGL